MTGIMVGLSTWLRYINFGGGAAPAGRKAVPPPEFEQADLFHDDRACFQDPAELWPDPQEDYAPFYTIILYLLPLKSIYCRWVPNKTVQPIISPSLSGYPRSTTETLNISHLYVNLGNVYEQ